MLRQIHPLSGTQETAAEQEVRFQYCFAELAQRLHSPLETALEIEYTLEGIIDGQASCTIAALTILAHWDKTTLAHSNRSQNCERHRSTYWVPS
jgi:hypothetical protein